MAFRRHDPLGYAPLLTPNGLAGPAYDPDYSYTPLPPPNVGNLVGSVHEINYGDDAYDPDKTFARPLLPPPPLSSEVCSQPPRPSTPEYSAFSPPPEDLYSDAEEDVKSDVDEETVENAHLEIQSLRFFARSPEEILKLSAVRVTTDKISHHGTPIVGGLRDPRFGCAGGRACGTCGARAKRCNGHFGSYELSTPLFNVAYNKFVMLWLRLICNNCGHVHVTEADVEGATLRDALRVVPSKCAHCSAAMRSALMWKSNTQKIVETSTESEITAEDALSVFKSVSDDHPVFKILTHPRRMITSVLFIPSIVIRPAVGGTEDGENARGESDLTYRLVKIVRADLLLKKKLSDPSCDYISKQSARLGLQNAYSGFIDKRQTYQKKSRPSLTANGTESGHQSAYKDLGDFLKGKSGYFRNNLSGNRVDHASRGVIAPFVGAHPTWVGIPKWMAQEMTKPLAVTSWNIKEVEKMVREKKVLFVTKSNGERVDLKLHPDPGPLEIGWSVSRILKEGDVVLMNRQPTLSKRSILAHRVKILENDRIFRLPMAVTQGYNADFDGDEMNLHVPQNQMAQAEAETLLCAEHSVINSANGQASVCNVQGDRLGAYKMSDPTSTITKSQWCVCLGSLSHQMQERARLRPPALFPCKASELWSLALPDHYNWLKGDVNIVDGRLLKGRLNKKILNILVHDIWADRGAEVSLDFVHSVHLVAGAYNSLVHPTTICFSEVSSSPEMERQCNSIILTQYNILEATKNSKHASQSDIESVASKCMSNATRQLTDLVYERSVLEKSGFRDLVESGAKGSRVNFSMVLGGLGKMLHFEDTRGVFPAIENTNGTRRSFTHNKKRDIFYDGFVTQGYSKGMRISEWCIHSKAGRRGLISSSNMVGRVGYMFRRLCTVLDSLTTWGGSVRDTATTAVVSWKYGDDGRSPFYVEKEKMMPTAKCKNISVPQTWKQNLKGLYEKLLEFAKEGETVDVPVSIRRIIYDIRCRQKKLPKDAEVAATSCVHDVERMCQTHGEFYGPLLMLWLRVHLHPCALHGLTAHSARLVVAEVDKRLWKSRVEDGEPVGLLCASSLSAAATQTTLDSFHHIGESDGDYNHLEECINLNRTRKNPKVSFKMNIAESKVADWVHTNRKIMLGDVVLEKSTPLPADKTLMAAYWEFPDDEDEVPFEPVMRLEVKTDLEPFKVKQALESVGCTRVCYALTPTGHYIFHTDTNIAISKFSVVISGCIQGLKQLNDGTVQCRVMSYKELEQWSNIIDVRSWHTNNFHQTKKLLGIEAARALVHRNLTQMLRTFGVTMGSRHIDLLCDKMTFSGELLGCTRHGLRQANQINQEGNYVQRATFEQPIDVMMAAASTKGEDHLNGPLARQVFGQTIYTGTNHPWMDLRIDKAFEKKHAVKFDTQKDHEEEDDDLDFGGADMWVPQQNNI